VTSSWPGVEEGIDYERARLKNLNRDIWDDSDNRNSQTELNAQCQQIKIKHESGKSSQWEMLLRLQDFTLLGYFFHQPLPFTPLLRMRNTVKSVTKLYQDVLFPGKMGVKG
jgi:hypothetical protein